MRRMITKKYGFLVTSHNLFMYQNPEIDEEVKENMAEHDLDEDIIERAKELVDEGLDEGDTAELAEGGISL